MRQGLYDGVGALFEEAIALQQKLLGPDHEETLSTQRQLARLHQSLGDYEQSDAVQLSVLERVFETDPLPRQALLQELSYRLDVTPRCVQVWFQNRRQKFKSAHLTQGLQPPTLKNASSWLTSLETLLPDLGPEPQRVTASQLRESAPKVRAAAHAGE